MERIELEAHAQYQMSILKPSASVLPFNLYCVCLLCSGDFLRVRAENFDEQICGVLDDIDVQLSDLVNGGLWSEEYMLLSL